MWRLETTIWGLVRTYRSFGLNAFLLPSQFFGPLRPDSSKKRPESSSGTLFKRGGGKWHPAGVAGVGLPRHNRRSSGSFSGGSIPFFFILVVSYFAWFDDFFFSLCSSLVLRQGELLRREVLLKFPCVETTFYTSYVLKFLWFSANKIWLRRGLGKLRCWGMMTSRRGDEMGFSSLFFLFLEVLSSRFFFMYVSSRNYEVWGT